jgi:hypothetical protein
VDLASDGVIHLDMGYEPRPDGFAWTLRRFSLTGGKRDDSYLSLVKHLNPGATAKEREAEAWKEILERKAPYDFKAKEDEDSTSIAAVLPLASGVPPQASGLYTLYLSKPGKQSQRSMRSRLEHVAETLRILEEKGAPISLLPGAVR